MMTSSRVAPLAAALPSGVTVPLAEVKVSVAKVLKDLNMFMVILDKVKRQDCP